MKCILPQPSVAIESQPQHQLQSTAFFERMFFHISKSSSSISAFFFTDIDVKTGIFGSRLSSSVSTGTVWPVFIQFNIVRLICALFVILFFWSIFTFRRFSLSSRHIFERPPIRDGFFGFGDDVFWSFCTYEYIRIRKLQTIRLTFLGIDDSAGDLIDFFADMTDVGVPGRNPKAWGSFWPEVENISSILADRLFRFGFRFWISVLGIMLLFHSLSFLKFY